MLFESGGVYNKKMLKKLAGKFDVKKQEKKIVIFFFIALIFYSVLILLVDIKKVFRVSSSFNWWIVLLLLLLSLLNYIFRFFRWHYFLNVLSIKISPLISLRIFLSGLSMTITPGKMGEVVKAYLIKKETGNRFAEMVPLLVTERLTDGIGMILLSLGGIYLFQQSVVFFIFAFGIVLIFFLFVYQKKFVLKIIKQFEKKFGHVKVLDFFIVFFENSQKLIKTKQLSLAIIISLIAWSFEGLSLFILINQFGSFWNWHSLLYSFLIFSFSSIAGFLVLIPGGIGIAEGSITSLLTLFFHLNLPVAIFITLIFRFSTLWFGVFMGLSNLFLSLSKP